ncbi:MAG TPA: hypothetical protein VK616_11880, partial [Flavitalea sp.]|nr:hypothetical protein [Flavitalea sp.]
MKKLFFKGLLAFLSVALLTQCTDTPSETTTEDGDSSAVETTAAIPPADDWKLGVQFWTFKNFPFVTAIEKADSAG